MSYNGFEIEIFGNKKLTQERVIDVVKKLPVPLSIYSFLDSNDLNVIKGKLKSPITIQYPSKKKVLEFFSDKDIYKALDSIHLSFGADELKRGYVNVYLSPNFSESAVEIYGETDLALELKKRRMQTWRQVAGITHQRGEEGELDRRVFDYGKIVAKTLIPNSMENNYRLILTDFYENFSIVSRDEFFGQLEKLIQENCEK